MQLERIGVALRPRAPREAIDLGTALLRRHARAVWSAWFAFTLPVFAVCQLLAWLLGLPWLGILLPWWLKPLFDRIPLYVLARAVFAQTPDWRQTLRGQVAWPWGPTLASLSWRRVDSNRTLRLPLEMLEGLPRRQRGARWRVLRRPLVATASGLAWGCLQFELVLFLSAWLFALLFIPQELLPQSLQGFGRTITHEGSGAPLVWAASVVTYLAMSAIEPLYVAAGFALYLNRRTQLEAWDIDLTFRRLRQRLLDASKVVALLLLCAGGLPTAARAATAGTAPLVRVERVFGQPASGDDARFAAAAAAVYRDPRFGGERKDYRWRPRAWAEPNKPVLRRPTELPVGNIVSGLLNALMWGVLVVAVIALGVFAWRRLPSLRPAPEGAAPPPAPLRSQTLVEAPLPDDLAGATRALWQARRHREALALLYRGSVTRTAAALQMPVPPEATEADWLRHAAQLEPVRRERLVAIVRAWQYAAYAGRYPDDAGVDALLAGWPAQRVGAA